MGVKSKYVSHKPDSQGLIPYTNEENETWEILIKRQKKIIENRACDEYVRGVEILKLQEKKIPQHDEVSKILKSCTGWSVVPVDAIIPAEEFFKLLSTKKFPAASFIRTRAELDYLQEPDIFHEMFGHCPLLTVREYADFMEEFGKLALAQKPKDRVRLFRVFWFTIEFGLIETPKGLRIYGGGILSSKEETVYSLEEKSVQRVPFETLTALRTPYRIDILQPLYFIIPNFEALFEILRAGNLIECLEQSKQLGDYPALFAPKDGKHGGYGSMMP